jgi:integrase
MNSTRKKIRLTDAKIRNLKTKDKLYRIKDVATTGLYIEVAISSNKFFRHIYTINGKRTMISIGKYPIVSLNKARAIVNKNLELLYNGIDPFSHTKKQDALKKTFKEVFFEWHKYKESEWSSRYAVSVIQRSTNHLFPKLGRLHLNDIDTDTITKVFEGIEKNDIIDTLYKVINISNQVFKYCIRKKFIDINPMANLDMGNFRNKKVRHYSTVTDPKKIGSLLNRIDKHTGSAQVKSALKLAPHVFLRPSELAQLTWQEINFAEKTIYIDASKMKMDNPHIVPMSSIVFKILKELKSYKLSSEFVFPSPFNKNQCISTNSLLQAIRGCGIDKDEFVTHGFRGMASTRLNEMGFRNEIIEIQLSHSEKNKIRAAYCHATYIAERREMMEWWSNDIMKLKSESLT